MKKIIKKIAENLYGYWMYLPLRYSYYFQGIRSFFSYLPHEQIIKSSIEFSGFEELGGDYLEFGVFRGESFIAAYHFAQAKKHLYPTLEKMRFYAFDSFQGLPEIKGIDAINPHQFKQGFCSCDVNSFRKNLLRRKIDLKKVTIVPGWYNQVLNDQTKKTLPLKKAAVIFIDCDLYESTVPVLNFITDYLQDGTIIIFHDWFAFRGRADRGHQRALGEWLVKNPKIIVKEFYKVCSSGNSFIINLIS